MRRHGLTKWSLPSTDEYHWPCFLVRSGPELRNPISPLPWACKANLTKIRKRLSGEVAIGRHHNTNSHNTRPTYGYFLNAPDNPPETLVCSIGSSSPFLGTSVIALDRDGAQSGTVENPPAYLSDSLYLHWQCSYAPFENVARVRVFYRPSSSLCMGMLLYYDNGAQRSLGQCRLHVDSSKTYVRPSYISILICRASESLSCKVEFDDPGLPEEGEGTWLHYTMTGTLECRFSSSSTILRAEEGSLILPELGTADDAGEGVLGEQHSS